MYKRKKASLNLSINAIVVLILAITMLGLGLAFMRNIFGQATSEFSEVTGTVQKQMIDQLKESQKIVDINNPHIKMKSNDKKQIFIGFKNDGNDDKSFQIRQIEASRLGASGANSTNIFNITNTSEVIQSGATFGLCGVRNNTGDIAPPIVEVYIEFKNAPTTISGNDVVVLPMNIHSTSSAVPGTCTYELKVDIDADLDYDEVVELTVDVEN